MDLSVILRTYNRADSLRKALEAFSRLVVPPSLNWELLLVDNNSKDHTHEVTDEFAKSSQFTVRYVFAKAQGRSNALNTGIAAAQGDVLAFTDDDVLLHPDWLSNPLKEIPAIQIEHAFHLCSPRYGAVDCTYVR